jgi:hypothetical protein
MFQVTACSSSPLQTVTCGAKQHMVAATTIAVYQHPALRVLQQPQPSSSPAATAAKMAYIAVQLYQLHPFVPSSAHNSQVPASGLHATDR